MNGTDSNEVLNNNQTTLSNVISTLEIIRKKWKFIALSTLLVTSMVAIYSLFVPNVYTATAKLVAASQDKGMMSAMLSQLGGLASLVGGNIGGPTKTDLYVSILRTETINDHIIDKFFKEEIKSNKRSDLYYLLSRIVTVSAGKKDGIITIAVSDRDPKRAADIANAYIDELDQLTLQLSAANAGGDRSFLEQRLITVKQDLAKAEVKLKKFQEVNSAISVPDQAKVSIEGIAQLRGQLASLEVELAGYKSQFTDASREVVTTKASINNLRKQIADLEGKGGKSFFMQAGSVPALAQEYVRLMREFKIQETLLEVYTKQLEIAKVSEAKKDSAIEVIQHARVPDAKSKPERRKMVEIAALFSLVASVFWVFLLENFSKLNQTDRKRIKSLLTFSSKS